MPSPSAAEIFAGAMVILALVEALFANYAFAMSALFVAALAINNC